MKWTKLQFQFENEKKKRMHTHNMNPICSFLHSFSLITKFSAWSCFFCFSLVFVFLTKNKVSYLVDDKWNDDQQQISTTLNERWNKKKTYVNGPPPTAYIASIIFFFFVFQLIFLNITTMINDDGSVGNHIEREIFHFLKISLSKKKLLDWTKWSNK